MNRFDRLTSILIQLQSKKLITAREIADRFEVSIRTVYRDIASLREAGVPVGEEEGKGYFMVAGYRLPPVMFSQEEANALVAAEKILAYHSEQSLRKNYESALLKIKAVLRSDDKEKVEKLNQSIAYHPPWAPASDNLTDIQYAITEQVKLQLAYLSKSKSEMTDRKVRPYALYFSGACWIVIGFCELRQDLREFRLDRIKSIKVTEEFFPPDFSFNLDNYIEERSKKKF